MIEDMIRQFPKLPSRIDFPNYPNTPPKRLEEAIQRKIFEEIHRNNNRRMVSFLRWTGHSESYLSGKNGSHRSPFYAEFDIACAFIHHESRLPVLVGYEVKWMDSDQPPAIHEGESQMNWLLEQDASYAYIIRPRPAKKTAEQVIPAMIDHLREKQCVGLWFIDVDKKNERKLRLDEALRPNYHNGQVNLDRLRFNLYLTYLDLKKGKKSEIEEKRSRIYPQEMPTWVETQFRKITDEFYLKRWEEIR